MSRKTRTAPDFLHRRRSYIWILIGILVILGGLGIALFFRFLPSVNHSQLASITIQPPRTAPALVVQQFCADLISNSYRDAYALLSSSARKQLDQMGGAPLLAQQLQHFADMYGTVTSCQITKVTGPSNNQATIMTQIQRQRFQAHQSETDQFDMIFEQDGWAINKWTSDIATT